MLNSSLVDLPSPSNLSYVWNFGSLLGLLLLSQVLTGVFLSMQFTGDIFMSFGSLVHLARDVSYGWVLRVLHANGASFFFFVMYLHIGSGLYYGSYLLSKTWLVGVTILLLAMATAFLGYVLPWGQMSFWAATVITNLLSAIPYVGGMLVEWIWGGFSVGNPTLTRFFSFHFILPFIILMLVVFHLFFLHHSGSSNAVGSNSNYDKVSFHPYFSLSDVFGALFFFIAALCLCFLMPYVFMDVENFMEANPMVTPAHIQPEWYFLFAYSILRAVPSSMGGVVALMLSVLVYYVLPFVVIQRFKMVSSYPLMKGVVALMLSVLVYYVLPFVVIQRFKMVSSYPLMKGVFWSFFFVWGLLTWIGACEVAFPFSEVGVVMGGFYFFVFLLWGFISGVQDQCVWF